jgi:hypothetical protein
MVEGARDGRDLLIAHHRMAGLVPAMHGLFSATIQVE